MPNIKSYKFRYIVCFMELGVAYRVYFQNSNTWAKDCKLIRTGKKGFNLLSISDNKCVFPRPIYQVDSAKKYISSSQKIFEIVLPDWVIRIEESSKNEIRQNLIGIKKPVIKNQVNALYRVELEA